MNNLIDKILTEWAYRVHDGMPNVKNPLHIQSLKESMEELDLPKDFIFEFIQSVLIEQNFYARNPKGKKISVFTDKDNYETHVRDKGYEPVDKEEAEAELSKQGDEKEPSKSGEQEPTREPEKTGTKVTKIQTHQFKGHKDELEKKEPNYGNMSDDELRDLDHNTTDKQLFFTKDEAKAQAEKKGPKGVGLGTPESRAGEAAVHYAVRKLVKGGNIDDVKRELIGIAKNSDTVLNKQWVNAAINTAEWIHDVYGDDIKEVAWDTPAAWKLLGVEGHGTSSDMFIQTKNGKNIGISLKQTTAVFLLNGGYDTQHKKLLNSLQEVLEPEELEKFEELTSVENYKRGFNKHLTTISDEFEMNNEFKEVITERIEEYKRMSDEEFKSIFDSTGYRKHLDDYEKIIRELPNVSPQSKIKFLVKMCKDSAIKSKFPQHYDNLKNEETITIQAILNAASSNDNVAGGLKKLCLDGMHAEDILFGKSEQLDEFVTLYGNKPAVELSKGVLLNIFGMKEQYESHLSIEDEAEKEEYKEQMLQEMNDKLVIDIKDGAKAGEVKIVHEEYGEFHLFGIKARAKPPGAALSLEMYQTSFMGNVIKEGTTDINQWKNSTKRKFVKTRKKELLEEMKDASIEQRQTLQKEIDKLESIS